jgi:transforming growth factor-beta-induced protein
LAFIASRLARLFSMHIHAQLEGNMRKFSFITVAVLLLALSTVPLMAQDGNITDVAAANPDFSTLISAVEAADPGVLEALSGPGPLTVFAPTNQAFANVASFLGIPLEDLLADQDFITALLQYHVIQGNVFSSQLIQDATIGETRLIPTLIPNASIGVVVNEDQSVVLNGVVNVVQTDLIATNGVIHVIDNVLLHRIVTDLLDEPTPPVVEPEPEPDEAVDIVFLRVAHLSPDAPAVDVFVDGEVALAGLAFGEISDWVTLPAGSYEVAVAPAGASIDDAVIGPSEFGLIDGWFTVAAVGSVEAGTLSVVTVTGDPEPAADEARVTVLHAIEDAPAVDVITMDIEVVIDDLSYPDFETIDVPAGTYDLAVVPTGEVEPVVIDLSGTELEAGSYYLVAAIGTLEEPDAAVSVTDADTLAALTAEVDEPVVTDDIVIMEGTIAEIVAESPDFSLLLRAVQAADPAVMETLSGPGPVTVFAPTDQAFRNLLSTLGMDLDDALTFPDLLTQILLYHVVSGEVSADQVVDLDGTSVPTLLENNAFLVEIVDGNVVLNRIVNVTETDMVASNGLIHVVDNVLLPQPVIDQLDMLQGD